MRKWLVLLTLCASPAAMAETLHCPVGGERFEVPAQGECTPDSRLTMTFTPASVCTGPQHLPQCPHNFLPMYKGFTSEDLALLEGFMLSESYDSSVDRSPYYLAYIIEKYIGESGSRLPLQLLLQGLVLDPANSFSDEVFLNDFLYEMQSAVRRAEPDNLAVMQALTSFVMIKAGRKDDAREMLMQASGQHSPHPALPAYLSAINACLEDQYSPFCNPRALIPLD